MEVKEKNRAISILKKVYHHTNTDYETQYKGIVGYKTDFLSEKEWSVLKKADLVPNKIEKYTHDGLVASFLKLGTNNKLTLDFAVNLFIKGLTGEFPRYRQTLISFLYLQNISEHTYMPSEDSRNCSVCGLPDEVTEDKTHNLYTYYLGHSWNEQPQCFVAELEDILQYSKSEMTEADKEILVKLLLLINQAHENETPSQLEKRIGKEKLLPKTDRYKRYGVLQTLAILGILPSEKERENLQPARSDIVMPLAGWRGRFGVNFKKAEEIFNITVPNMA